MEITFCQQRTHIYSRAPVAPPPIVRISNIISSHKSYVHIPTTSSPSVEITLPLYRPQHKYQQPIEQISKRKVVGDDHEGSSTPLDILRLMDSLKLPITVDLYVSLIKECTESGDPLEANELHNHVKKSGIHPNLHFLNLLLLMYVCCNCMHSARELFDKSSVRNVYTWAVMIGGYFETGEHGEVIDLFLEMLSWDRAKCKLDESISSNTAVYGILVCVLKACVRTMDIELGKQVHGLIIRSGYSRSSVLSSSLMRFYSEFGFSGSSENVFSQVAYKNMVTWTTKIVNCCKDKRFDMAIDVFREMGKEGMKGNKFTFSSVLKACGRMKDEGCFGRQVHASAIKLGLEFDEYVQCGLVDMYGKYGSVSDAKRVFRMRGNDSNAACWNALVSGYMKQGLCIESIQILYQMKAAGLQLQESLLKELRSICG